MEILDFLKRTGSHLKSLFLSGLFTIIPIAATLFFIHFIYNLVARSIAPIYQLEPAILHAIPGSNFIISMVLILTIGVILKIFITHQIIHYFERLINRIPLIRIVYSSAKIVVDFFRVSETTLTAAQRRVVLIPYPQKGQFHLAFLLDSAEHSYEKVIPDAVRHYPGERYVKVFMPHSPNPTTGFFFIMPESDLVYTDITFEEAIKTLVSCGLITPESIKKLQ